MVYIVNIIRLITSLIEFNKLFSGKMDGNELFYEVTFYLYKEILRDYIVSFWDFVGNLDMNT
jgi:hypothetical protein